VGVVVVDPLPLFRTGAIAALGAAGVRVLGEAAHLVDGIPLALASRAGAVLVGGASVGEVKQAVTALPACAVVVLLAQPSRTELVEMLGAGVAGLALRSLTADELVGTVEGAAEAVATSGVAPGPAAASGPVFAPFPVGPGPAQVPDPAGGGPNGTLFTPKEREILGQLAQGLSNKRIAEALYVTPATVKTHLAHIYAKLGAKGRHEALTHALSMGLLR
jgi:DNA-binding NarL/FixJ family response regulator